MARKENFPFTAEQIGSEILERFSADIYKPKAIIRELLKNAYDSYFELDHYLEQNSLSVDYEPAVEIDAVPNANTLVVSDRGLGLDIDGLRLLISIALTEKREVPGAAGFRGIGFWSAYTGGETVVVESTKLGADRRYTLTLNTKAMRERQGPATSLGAIMNDPQCVQLTSEDADKSEHYTKVLIRAAEAESRLHTLLAGQDQLRKLLIDGCSLRADPATRHRAQIDHFYSRWGVRPAILKFQGTELQKEIPASVGDFREHKLECTIGNKRVLLARVWYATNTANQQVDSQIAGIRTFRESFPIGRPNLYSEPLVDSSVDVTRPDLLGWHIGEVHLLHEDLRPDASGEGIRDSVTFSAFREELRRFYSDLITDSYAKQRRGTLSKQYDKWRDKVVALKQRTQSGQSLGASDRDELKEIASSVGRDNAQARGKLKSDVSPTSKEVLVRDPEIKKKRREVTALLKTMQTQLKAPAQTSKKPKPTTAAGKDDQKPTDESSGASPLSRAVVLALVDEIRDAVSLVLKDEPTLRADLIKRINQIATRVG